MANNYDEYHSATSTSSDDDTYSTGGDSGFSVGQELKELHCPEKEPMIAVAAEEASFLHRFASIPIIQDSLSGAQNMMKQHTMGQKAFDYAETVFNTAQHYLPNSHNSRVLSGANSLGNRSLDLIEQRFPSLNGPTDKLVEPIKGRLENAILQVKETKSAVVNNPRMDYIADQLESIMDQYLPNEETTNDTEKDTKHGMDRLLSVVNALSSRTSKKIAEKASATIEEEKQIKQMISAWVMEHVDAVTKFKQQQQQQHMESFKARFVPTILGMYEFTQAEFDKFRQELLKPNISYMDRARNVLTLSRTDLLEPLYQASFLSIWKGNQQQQDC